MEKKKNYSKEIDITGKNSTFITKFGTFEENLPKVVYIHAKAKVLPMTNKKNYSNDIKTVKDSFSEYVEDFFKKEENTKYSDKFLCSCDVSENSIVFGKKSNLKYEVLVKPLQPRRLEEYTDDMKELSTLLSNQLESFMNNEGFKVL